MRRWPGRRSSRCLRASRSSPAISWRSRREREATACLLRRRAHRLHAHRPRGDVGERRRDGALLSGRVRLRQHGRVPGRGDRGAIGAVRRDRRLSRLAQRSPLLALAMLLFLLSLGGIPFVAGFWAKLYVFLAGVEQGSLAWSSSARSSPLLRCITTCSSRDACTSKRRAQRLGESGPATGRSDRHLPGRRDRNRRLPRPVGCRRAAYRADALYVATSLPSARPLRHTCRPRSDCSPHTNIRRARCPSPSARTSACS